MVEASHLPLIDRPGVHRQKLARVQQADQVGPTDPSHLITNDADQFTLIQTTFSSFRVLTGRGLMWRGPDFRSPESCSRHVREAGVDVNTFNVNIVTLTFSLWKTLTKLNKLQNRALKQFCSLN